MSAHCHAHAHSSTPPSQGNYRRALWVALIVNFAMFAVEVLAGAWSGSVSLLADSIDFLGDALNYGVSLTVLGMAVVWRSRAAMLKGACMLVFGLAVLAKTAWAMQAGVLPLANTMGLVGALALVANVGVALMLYRYRNGDANMRSVWLCTRNDAIGNIAVLIAAAAVWGTGSAWPDWLVAFGMATLAIHAGGSVLAQARREMSNQLEGAN